MRYTDRFYDAEIAFEAFGHEDMGIEISIRPPGNGPAVIETINFDKYKERLEAIGKGSMK